VNGDNNQDKQEENNTNINQNATSKDYIVYGVRFSVNSNLKPYSPQNIKIFYEKYKVINTIYSLELAAAEVLLVEDIDTRIKYAAKHVKKGRLNGEMFHQFIKNEMALHYSLCRLSSNIVVCEEYYEGEESYVMVMEYSNQPDYFNRLLEKVFYLPFNIYFSMIQCLTSHLGYSHLIS
jgi:serine/threonine protein kinase